MYSTLKRIFIGQPLSTADEGHQRLVKVIALAIFASDAISSTAYATDEILLVLVKKGGMAALDKLIPIAIVVAILLAIVVASYRQTIFAYPGGGGAYIVSRENLGVIPALVAGSSLLVDYILTVSVSVAGGVLAITSTYPGLRDYRIPICLGFIVLMTLANLRGVKESGKLFAPPTYIYAVSLVGLIVWGLIQSYTGHLGPMPVNEASLEELGAPLKAAGAISLFTLLRGFSSGAVALSGVEAISNGVPSFRKPESRNASTTLIWMAAILGTTFVGLSILAHRLQPTVSEHQSLLSILGEYVYGRNVFFYILQFATFGILILAANTAFNGYPLLSSLIARDGYLPRQLANRGDRLVFSNGVLGLAVFAAVLIVAFGGNVTALIPLYAVGVFTGFTLSQAGMVVHHRRLKEPGWKTSMVINGVGCAATGIVLAVVVVSKFAIGAWIPVVLIPAQVLLLRAIGKHYSRVRKATVAPPDYKPRRHTHFVVVLVGSLNKGTLDALHYAKSLAPDRLIAISVVGDEAEQEELNRQWMERGLVMELHTIYSPYRELTQPVLDYLDELDAESEDDLITVVIPEYVVTTWYTQALHNQSALALKARLLFRPHTVVTSVPAIVD
jgi:amino acid transporter